jgi:hypothetical protein
MCRWRNQSAVGTRPPSTSTPPWPACWPDTDTEEGYTGARAPSEMPVGPPLAVVTTHPSVRKTGGYCWSSSFNVLGVLFLGAVSSAFLPSKTASWTPKFRHLGVDQQYPPVCWTHAEQPHPGARACTETQSINQRRVGGGPRSFSTPADRSASQKLSTPVRRCPRLCCSPSRRRGRRPQPSQWPGGCRADAEGTRPARSYPGPPWGFSTPRSSDAPPHTASA